MAHMDERRGEDCKAVLHDGLVCFSFEGRPRRRWRRYVRVLLRESTVARPPPKRVLQIVSQCNVKARGRSHKWGAIAVNWQKGYVSHSI